VFPLAHPPGRPGREALRGRLSVLLAALGLAPSVSPAADGDVFFESRVRPLLVARCQECHGAKVSEGGLRLDSHQGVVAGGRSGPAAVAGDIGASRLIAAVRRTSELPMPPDDPLGTDEVAILERWVADGLAWSGTGGEGVGLPPSPAADMETRLAEALATHWAFQPPQRHEPPAPPAGFPAAIRSAWAETAIDRFLAEGIAAAGLVPAPAAPPRQLVRRLSFDLTGLPPSAADVDAFATDPSDAAYVSLVDRLLASREHAEHWARKWLDLARYADTMGYVFDGQTSTYPFAWTYRDWVVAALHRDLPYDRFVVLQIAADLVDPPVPPADLAALGFLTVGRTFMGNEHDVFDDRIDLVTRGLMGLTVACARCHDHKYEPVGMADYYALHGVFASCAIPESLPVIGEARPGPEADAFAATMDGLERREAEYVQTIHERASREAIQHAADYLLETSRPLPRPDGRPPQLADGYEIEQLLVDRLVRKIEGAGPGHPVIGLWAAVRNEADEAFATAVAAITTAWHDAGESPVNTAVRAEVLAAVPTTPRSLAEAFGRLIARAHAAAGTPADDPELAAVRETFTMPGAPLVVLPGEVLRVARRPEQVELRKRRRDIADLQAKAAGGPPRAMVLRDVPQPQDSPIFLRGQVDRPGEIVPRRLPRLLGGAAVDRRSSGRLELARAIASPANPLAARLIVNWVWTHHFGRGLVATPGDLGLRGDPPSHPELLDDLARRFVEDGRWSLRWLHREIVTSRAWRQASLIRPEVREIDPDNRLVARANRRRLDWEAWRDSLCAAAGTLDPARGGGPGIDPTTTERIDVRSLYARLDRQDVPGILRSFDIANPDAAVHARVRTIVPPQSLASLNAPLVVEAARRLADRAAAEAGPDDDAFVRSVWRAALSRDPAAEERSMATAWLADEGRREPSAEVAGDRRQLGPRQRLVQAVLATAEFEFLD